MNKAMNNLRTGTNVFFTALLVAGMSAPIFAQDKVEEKTEKTEKKKKEKKDNGKLEKTDKKAASGKYRRSSLHTMIVEEAKMPNRDLILTTFKDAPVPSKYNDHTVTDKSFDLANYGVVSEEAEEGKKKKEKDVSPAINKFFAENKTANKIVAKWFNRTESGAFDMKLIQERGMYDASAKDAGMASSTERGAAVLADAGIELIGSTFVVVNRSKFVTNEVPAKIAHTIAIGLANALPNALLQKGARVAADKAYEKARQGYSIWTTAYLYQLSWTDSVEAVFWQDMWMDESNIDAAKKEVFDNSDLFQLKLLGFQKASAFISGMGKNAQDKDMIIKNATIKSVNAVYAKLQRKFEKFRTKTPLVSASPLAAKIGLKEGLEAGDKYEVLEQEQDADGKITYKRKAVIKVDKKKIWNNNFNLGEAQVDAEGNPTSKDENGLEYTIFKGPKNLYPGMLIRQIN